MVEQTNVIDGFSRLVVEYDGSGDNGWIELKEVYDAQGNSIDIDSGGPVIQALQSVAEQVLEEKYGGWENNEGASGTLEWTPEEGWVGEHIWNVEANTTETLNVKGANIPEKYSRVTIEFNGYLDDEQIDFNEAYDLEVNLLVSTKDEQTSLCDIAKEILDKNFPDWSVEEGSFGEMLFRKEVGWEITYNARYMDTETEGWVLG
jgi:hypothetical protein